MSSTTTPISPVAFAAALRDLPLSSLHLKAAELRNSIAHLDYSNEQLRPFADGTAPNQAGEADPDCVEAIQENEAVIARMEERISLLRSEVEGRGQIWGEVLAGKEEDLNGESDGQVAPEVNGDRGARSEAWRDGTFQTGRIVNGEVQMDSAHATTTTTNGTSTNATPNGVNGTGVTSTNSNSNGVNGTTGGRLDDEALRRAMDERMRALAEEGDSDGGMHL